MRGSTPAKSTEEGLEQEFNSLDAQREAGEAYIKQPGRRGLGVPADRYDDGGFTGGNMDRPALRRLLADIEAGQDRLRRRLQGRPAQPQPARLRPDDGDVREAAGVVRLGHPAVQHRHIMGRLMLNVLLSFAQFEREIIGERTRDKIAATRRKGKWAGGCRSSATTSTRRAPSSWSTRTRPTRVREIFELYLEHESLLPVVEELDRRGWREQALDDAEGRGRRAGKPFTKTSLLQPADQRRCTPARCGTRTRSTTASTPAIVDAERLAAGAGAAAAATAGTGGAPVRNQFGALLKGLLRCVPCDCAMTPTHTTKRGPSRYRYYVCSHAQKQGWRTCPSKSVPAGQIEEFVVDQHPVRRPRPRPAARGAGPGAAPRTTRDGASWRPRRGLEKDLKAWHGEVRTLSGSSAGRDNGELVGRLADLHERIARGGGRVRRCGPTSQPRPAG